MTTRVAKKDANGITQPQRPRRINDSLLPRGGSNTLGKIRRDLVMTFNNCARDRKQMENFQEIILFIARENKKFIAEIQEYDEDCKQAATDLQEVQVQLNTARKLARKLEDQVDPRVAVFGFKDGAKLDAWAEKLGVKLDGRKTLEFMQADFIKKYKETK